VPSLHGARHAVISDRIEAATFLCAVAATGGDIVITNTRTDILDAALVKLREVGLQMTIGPNSIRAKMEGRPRPVTFTTTEYPGFPTDMQAQFMAVNTIAGGGSHVTETIFENRFMHVQEMNRLGAAIRIDGNTAHIAGVNLLRGAPVMATDLRASASLVIAAMAAEGTTLIERIYHLDRGYDRMEVKLSAVGADIVRIK
jgi:UDP-N-acetylglucosamine 1-carboxyvinyltransferase